MHFYNYDLKASNGASYTIVSAGKELFDDDGILENWEHIPGKIDKSNLLIDKKEATAFTEEHWDEAEIFIAKEDEEAGGWDRLIPRDEFYIKVWPHIKELFLGTYSKYRLTTVEVSYNELRLYYTDNEQLEDCFYLSISDAPLVLTFHATPMENRFQPSWRIRLSGKEDDGAHITEKCEEHNVKFLHFTYAAPRGEKRNIFGYDDVIEVLECRNI